MQNKPGRSGPRSGSRPCRHRFHPRLAPLERRTVLSVVAPPGVSSPSVEVNSVTTAHPYGPSQVYQGYGFNRVIFQQGSNYILGKGDGQTIAIVDAYRDDRIGSDLKTFDAQMGLPDPPNFLVLNQSGGTDLSGVTSAVSNQRSIYSWSAEESLDVEWEHTIAPNANIVLIEANNNVNVNLYTAVQTAAQTSTYTQYGLPPAGVVSNSWGGGESPSEVFSDSTFTSLGNAVTFVFSSGDTHPVEYPSTSPNVLAVGGTSLKLQTGAFGTTYNGEGWYDTSKSDAGGGGSSAYESEPSYQLGVQGSGHRQTPDVAMNADGSSSVLIYDTNAPWAGYYGEFGTSEAAPMYAATLAIVDQGLTLATGTFTTLGNAQAYVYQMPGVTGGLDPSSGPSYHDVTGSFNYVSNSGTTTLIATAGYDTLTGLGSPVPTVFIPNMINYALSHGANPTPSGAVGGSGDPGGGLQPGNGDPDFLDQTSVNFAGGGHFGTVVSPSQVALTASTTGAALGQIGVVQASSQSLVVSAPSVSSPSAAIAFAPAGQALIGQPVTTASKPLPAAPDGLELDGPPSDVLRADGPPSDGLPVDGLRLHGPFRAEGARPTPVDEQAPASGRDSSEALTLPDHAIGEGAAVVVLAADTPSGPIVEESPVDREPGDVPAEPSSGRIMTAGLALVLGHGVFNRRETRRKRPSLKPRD